MESVNNNIPPENIMKDSLNSERKKDMENMSPKMETNMLVNGKKDFNMERVNL